METRTLPNPQESSTTSSSSTTSTEDSTLKHKRSVSGSILSKLSFLRSSNSNENQSPSEPSPEFLPGDDHDRILPKRASRSMAAAVQNQKTRRRRGSLRKAALLGRGAQRDKKEIRASPLETVDHTPDAQLHASPTEVDAPINPFGLTPPSRPPPQPFRSPNLVPIRTLPMGSDDVLPSPTLTYTSTSEEDVLTMPARSPQPVPSSGSDSYFPSALMRRRSSNQKTPSSISKSPLSLSTSPLLPNGVP